MNEEDAPGFTVVDRRSSGDDVVEATDETVASMPEVAPDVDQTDAEPELQMPPPEYLLNLACLSLSVTELCATLVFVLDQKARIHMGLLADPNTGEVKVSLDDARLAIDLIQFLAPRVRREIPPEAAAELDRRTNDLRMNFVTRSQGPTKDG
ncbi:MAG: DUF1844 domain-containing protein [Armatimonadetes bacterium]|nr:DUF1844 domain-containing protein [Armatimonadota bacterium]MDE2205588.1 DUF1844 domain-containing protein [Armatimonadota bacterium]